MLLFDCDLSDYSPHNKTSVATCNRGRCPPKSLENKWCSDVKEGNQFPSRFVHPSKGHHQCAGTILDCLQAKDVHQSGIGRGEWRGDRSFISDSWVSYMAAVSPSRGGGEKKHWWFTNRKMVERYVREARMLMATQEASDMSSALGLLEAAQALAPRMEVALELKARCLLYLGRFKVVADMLQDYIPSLKLVVSEDASSSGLSDGSSTQLSKEQVKLLSSDGGSLDRNDTMFKCFSVSDLKKKVMAGLCKNVERERQWRYSLSGQACGHLGLMEDAMVLLQTGKRLATAAFRRESISLSDDVFTSNKFPLSDDISPDNHPQNRTKTESESISQLLCQIKLLIRRKTAAYVAARWL